MGPERRRARCKPLITNDILGCLMLAQTDLMAESEALAPDICRHVIFKRVGGHLSFEEIGID